MTVVRLPADDADVAAAAITTTSRRHEMQLAARRIRWICLLCACALADQRVNTANNDTAQTGSTSVRHVPSRPPRLSRRRSSIRPTLCRLTRTYRHPNRHLGNAPPTQTPPPPTDFNLPGPRVNDARCILYYVVSQNTM